MDFGKDDEYLKDKKERRRNRYSYLDDFSKSASGEYVYIGKMWKYDGDMPFNMVKRPLISFSLALLLVSLSSGLVATPGASYIGYILIPYALEFVLSLVIFFKVFTLFRKGEEVRDYDYKKTRPQFLVYFWSIIITSAISMGGEIVYVILNGASNKAGMVVLYIASRVFVIALAYVCTIFTKKLVYKIK